jgi:hypothetical protein
MCIFAYLTITLLHEFISPNKRCDSLFTDFVLSFFCCCHRDFQIWVKASIRSSFKNECGDPVTNKTNRHARVLLCGRETRIERRNNHGKGFKGTFNRGFFRRIRAANNKRLSDFRGGFQNLLCFFLGAFNYFFNVVVHYFQ